MYLCAFPNQLLTIDAAVNTKRNTKLYFVLLFYIKHFSQSVSSFYFSDILTKSNMDRQIRNQIPMGIPKRSPMALSAQHDELITYIHEAWHKVTSPGPHGGPTFYRNPPELRLTGFQPFDLERWWGRRVVQNIHNISKNHQ